MRKVLLVLGFVLGIYLIVRGVVELIVIDMADPASYERDWGGPSLAGVLLVHSGPGVVAAALILWWLVRRSRTRRSGATPAA